MAGGGARGARCVGLCLCCGCGGHGGSGGVVVKASRGEGVGKVCRGQQQDDFRHTVVICLAENGLTFLALFFFFWLSLSLFH